MKKNIIVMTMSAALIGCGGSDSGSSENKYGFSSQCPEPQEIIYVDSFADNVASHSVADIKETRIGVNDCMIKVTFELLSPPKNIKVNNAGKSDNELEYAWEVYFDVDGDGTYHNDISLSASYFKKPGAGESLANVPDVTQNGIGHTDVNGPKTITTKMTPIFAALNGNALTLAIKRSEWENGYTFRDLSKITPNTPFRVRATYQPNSSGFVDIYPNSGGYHNPAKSN
ncbi:hypothetical protein TUMSATVNIG1_37020 [Vibrio nigripulchritudo]|nr:hypothetical protein VNTUMSATTG_36720 [Vibrio nigripulchritudo]BDU33093.1 hypothetical protein TUMSATVNIG1_37020 [Vibrio nigripulchritudo]